MLMQPRQNVSDNLEIMVLNWKDVKL